MNDKSIREILISWLQATNHEIRIYQEKSIGASICDVMAVTDKLTGYEITEIIESELPDTQMHETEIAETEMLDDEAPYPALSPTQYGELR